VGFRVSCQHVCIFSLSGNNCDVFINNNNNTASFLVTQSYTNYTKLRHKERRARTSHETRATTPNIFKVLCLVSLWEATAVSIYGLGSCTCLTASSFTGRNLHVTFRLRSLCYNRRHILLAYYAKLQQQYADFLTASRSYMKLQHVYKFHGNWVASRTGAPLLKYVAWYVWDHLLLYSQFMHCFATERRCVVAFRSERQSEYCDNEAIF
jgi:hypothetical protein